MGDFPANVGAYGKAGVPDDASGLKDAGQPAKGSGSDDRKQGVFRGKGGTEAMDASGDFCHTSEDCPQDWGKHGKSLNPCG